jgi:hypothetical protein
MIRIGDAERDRAVAVLSDHFVAGRLTQEEFEERSDQATRARYTDDLAPLFEDLPDESPPVPAVWGPGAPRVRQAPPAILFLAPILMIGLVVAAVTFTAPWILWMFFWVALLSRPFHHRHAGMAGRGGRPRR